MGFQAAGKDLSAAPRVASRKCRRGKAEGDFRQCFTQAGKIAVACAEVGLARLGVLPGRLFYEYFPMM
jgi:hypothetical protein